MQSAFWDSDGLSTAVKMCDWITLRACFGSGAVFYSHQNAKQCVITHQMKFTAVQFIKLLDRAEIIMQSWFISAFKGLSKVMKYGNCIFNIRIGVWEVSDEAFLVNLGRSQDIFKLFKNCRLKNAQCLHTLELFCIQWNP